VFACAMALEENLAVTRAFTERAYDFVGHGERWVQHFGMAEDKERASIRRATDTIQRLTGQRISGWFTRPLPSLNTRRLLVEEGFLYDCDSYADDLPYYEAVDGRRHLIVPYTVEINDIRYWKGTIFTAGDWFSEVRDCFDTLYEESRRTPKMMSVGLHPRIIGRPGRIQGLERFLSYVRGHERVWICRRTDLALHWLRETGGGNGP
jgi:allantoinase